jgi:hypothetical protein
MHLLLIELKLSDKSLIIHFMFVIIVIVLVQWTKRGRDFKYLNNKLFKNLPSLPLYVHSS